jgi:hypothetical protein
MAGKKFLQTHTSGVGTIEKNSVTTSADTPVSGDIVAVSTGGKIDKTLLNSTTVSAGAGDVDKVPLLNASGQLDMTVLPAGLATAQSIVASEALAAGDWINVYNNAGTVNMRKADGSATGKPANGYVLAAVASAATGTAYFDGINTQLSGLTGGIVWLSTSTPGGSQQAIPSGTGKVNQVVATAVSATAAKLNIMPPIELA